MIRRHPLARRGELSLLRERNTCGPPGAHRDIIQKTITELRMRACVCVRPWRGTPYPPPLRSKKYEDRVPFFLARTCAGLPSPLVDPAGFVVRFVGWPTDPFSTKGISVPFRHPTVGPVPSLLSAEGLLFLTLRSPPEVGEGRLTETEPHRGGGIR